MEPPATPTRVRSPSDRVQAAASASVASEPTQSRDEIRAPLACCRPDVSDRPVAGLECRVRAERQRKVESIGLGVDRNDLRRGGRLQDLNRQVSETADADHDGSRLGPELL